VLTPTPSDTERIRTALKDYQIPYQFLWEDSAERGYLVRKFRENISSVLVGSGFWEGIDVPGEALSLLVIWRLPFPPRDPLIQARRREAQEKGLDPVTAVDYPEMGLQLKQGCGRLMMTRLINGIFQLPAEQLIPPPEQGNPPILFSIIAGAPRPFEPGASWRRTFPVKTLPAPGGL